MAFAVTQAFNHTAECAAADNKQLRLFTVAVNLDWGKYHKPPTEPCHARSCTPFENQNEEQWTGH